MPLVSQFIQDGSSDSRTHGRRAIVAILRLLNTSDVEPVFKKYLTEVNLKRVMEVVEKLSPVQSRPPKTSLASPSPTISRARTTSLGSPAVPPRAKQNLTVI